MGIWWMAGFGIVGRTSGVAGWAIVADMSHSTQVVVDFDDYFSCRQYSNAYANFESTKATGLFCNREKAEKRLFISGTRNALQRKEERQGNALDSQSRLYLKELSAE
ncbi:hypothetical protein F5Y19DRAFT_421149 [Xylariaceae sp. FL1651]|nr:hypothetical protein F5Y19DRAFT_421149 [Xylariaceae sp. FL1651]